MVSVEVNVRPLLKVEGDFSSIVRVPSHPAIEDMFTQWADRYSAFVRRRFNQYSRGGGDWAPLALSTVQRRRRGKRGSVFTNDRGQWSRRLFVARDTRRGMLVASPAAYAILRDTGSLFGALTIGARGNLTRRGPGTVTFGIEGGATGKGVTLGQIARWHDKGAEKLPQRRILVQPSAGVVRNMASDSALAARKIVDEIGRSV
jgi:hypothetical protein